MHLRPFAAGLALFAVLLAGGVAALPASAAPAPTPRVLASFPDDRLTVADRTQLTGRRVALPLTNCAVRQTTCDVTRLLNQLDGFDLDPRMSITFSRPVDPAVVASRVKIEKVRGLGPALSAGVERVVYDPQHASVFMHPATQLAPSTTYRLSLRAGGGLPGLSRLFTTMSATTDLRRMIAQLDAGTAFERAGIPADERGLIVDQVVPVAGTTLAYTADQGPATGTVTTAVPNIAGTNAASYVFGSYYAPSWLTADRVIPQTPTGGSGPPVRGKERVPFVMIVPSGSAPAGGWPVAVFGHGFTRSNADVFLAAAFNAVRGVATIAADVVGHGFGPRSEWSITRDGVTTTTPAYGRGIDQDRNGRIEATEGVSAPVNPSRLGAVGSRDGLRQTVTDLSTLVRALGRGVDVPGTTIARTGVSYYGQSFGGIYGTMLGGADPKVDRLALNVPGGPATEVTRLSPAFRPLTAQTLGGSRPGLLNGGYVGFTESMPLTGDPVVRAPVKGALPIQEYLAQATWLTRSGSPEAFAPLLRATPAGGRPTTKRVLFQIAYGDQTVPNPTSHTLLAAGGLFDRASLYRNDRTPQASQNPHGFLLNPTFTQGALNAQKQVIDFLLFAVITDPDAAGAVWEVPIADPKVLRNLNFDSPLHK